MNKKPKTIKWTDLLSQLNLKLKSSDISHKEKYSVKTDVYSIGNYPALWYVWNNRQKKGGEIPLNKHCVVTVDDDNTWVCVQLTYFNFKKSTTTTFKRNNDIPFGVKLKKANHDNISLS